ncbi:MAG: LPD38 domain-containing protein, partial [Hydrogenophaga sp.]
GTGGLSIPMRSDIFAFPKVLAEHMWHHITEDGTLDGANTRRSMTDLLANSVVGPYAPQAIKPAVEVAINYDFFRQRPIVGASLSGAAGEHQFTDSTSELSKAIGAGTGLSPAKLDHLIRGYLGSLGGLIMFMSNDAIALAMENPRPEMPLWDAIASFPGASTLLPKQNDSAARQDFYELKEAVDRVTQTLTLLNGRSPEQLDKYLSDPVVEARYGLSSEVRAIYEDLSEIRKAITLIRNDPEVSAAQKRADIEELRQAELELLSSLPLKEMRREAKL